MSEKEEDLKIYKPKGKVLPLYETNPIVDNYTAENGRVYNRSEKNAVQAKKEVDANEK